jgi:competence protein ComEC
MFEVKTSLGIDADALTGQLCFSARTTRQRTVSRSSRTVLVVVLLLLAGCSSGVDPGATATSSPSTERTGTPTTASPSGTATGTTTTGAQGTLEVHFINVGQSVSTLIVGPTGETMLIDTGDYRNDGADVLSYLQAQGIDRIDHLVTSHADADHIGGHAAVIEYYETEAQGVGAIYDPGISSSSQTYADYLDAVEEHNVTLYSVRTGDTIPFDGASIQVLAPPEGYLDGGDRNENSIVLRVDHGETSFLFTGDTEADGESYLLNEHRSQLPATVLKAGHHGSGSSTSGPLLDAVGPKLVVISSAYDSQYGHPHEETLQRLADRNIDTYWTGVHGTVLLTRDGQTLTVAAQQEATTTPLDLREYPAVAPGSSGALETRATYQVGTGDGGGGGTTTAPSTTTSATDGQLVLATVHADAAGTERDNLNDEYLVFENTGGSTLDIGGWTVADEAGHTYTVPAGVTVAPGATITLHTGSGTDTETDLYWGADQPVWNNGGDTVTVKDDDGTVVLQERYD